MRRPRLAPAVSNGAFALGLLLGGASAGRAADPPAAPRARPAAPAGGDEDADDPTIVVNGQRQRGAVVSDIPPEQQLGPADIRAYGVNSVTELLDELAPQTRSDRGRGGGGPVVLLNGRRIASFAEVRDLPTEAIQRVDILPEEVALSYGYTADQRVVNIVLRRRFRAVTGQLDGSTTTEGGASGGTASADLLRIHGDSRFNLDLKLQAGAALRENQRGIVSAGGGGRPFDVAGNIAASGGGEIDPALSAAAGMPVTIAGVPAAAASGPASLADFAANANDPNVTDVSRYRTLSPSTRQVTINSVWSRPLSARVNATINGTFQISSSDALRGLPGASLLVPAGNRYSPFSDDVSLYRYLGDTALRQNSDGTTGHIGVTLGGDLARWRWSLTGNYDRTTSRTVTQRGIDATPLQAALDAADPLFNPFGPIAPDMTGGLLADRARSRSDSGNVQLVANGPLLTLPAGALAATIKLGGAAEGYDAHALHAGIATASDLTRRTGSGQLSLDLPITSRRNHILPAIGDLSANFNLAYDQLSDFGTLRTLGYGLNWKPRDAISLLVSVTDDENAPTTQQLGGPAVVTPDVRAFDYLRGQTVDIVQIGGGNPDLQGDRRRVFKLGLTLKPFGATDLTLTANYIRSRIRNGIASLPEPTAAIESAFPDRFVRDEDGDLLSIDTRPVNFAREDRQELRWGINFSRPLRSSQHAIDAMRAVAREEFARRRAAAGEGAAGAVPPGGFGGGPGGSGGEGGRGDGRGGSGRGGGGGGLFGQNSGRIQFSLYHTWFFRDDILIRDGVPLVDLLDGGSVGSGGGQPQHEIEAQLGYSNNGIGARLTGDWKSGTIVDGGPGSATGDLHFSDLATANLRLFVNLGQQPGLVRHAWARGARVSLSVTNLFDSRLHVHDAAGDTPLRYQPAYLDPLGRTVKISLRKLFF